MLILLKGAHYDVCWNGVAKKVRNISLPTFVNFRMMDFWYTDNLYTSERFPNLKPKVIY